MAELPKPKRRRPRFDPATIYAFVPPTEAEFQELTQEKTAQTGDQTKSARHGESNATNHTAT